MTTLGILPPEQGRTRERHVVPTIPLAFLRLAALVAISLCLAGCGKTESYRYKLTLAVNTPEGVKHSSGVVELVFYEVSIPARGIMHKLRGEALYLDLGPGAKPLIALLTSQLHPKYGKEQRWTRDAGPDDNLLYGLYGPPPPQSKNYFDDLPRIARMLDNAGSPLLTCPTS
jgi:hypothetical protein